METTYPASMKDYQEMQNIVPTTLSIPVLKMPISPEEARKESPKTAEICMLVIGLNRLFRVECGWRHLGLLR